MEFSRGSNLNIFLPLVTRRCGLVTLCVAILAFAPCHAIEIPPEVREAEGRRIEVVARVSAPTVAVFDAAGEGGGSGVLISADGYALTNFHVTMSCGAAMKCGLADGRLYDAVIVGIDAPGDVALIKLLGRDDFPYAELGNSDQAEVGDWVIVAGNPFLLADDFTPTITYGILSGTHRYQYPAGTLLEYADCLQTDASINPGNSGGPMFSSEGLLIGINGRGSFEKRGRVNVGVGYAISINQIKRFLSHLKAGRLVDHATLGATVTSVAGGRVAVDDLLESSDAYRRGLRYGDYIHKFGNRPISSANALQNALGTYPSGWRVPIEFRRHDQTFHHVVRLESLHAMGELESLLEAGEQNPERIEPPQPGEEKEQDKQEEPKLPIPGRQRPPKPKIPKVVENVYEERRGFANYWFNRQGQRRVAESCRQIGSLDAKLPLVLVGTDVTGGPILLQATGTEADYRSSRGQFYASFERTIDETIGPPGSGGLMGAAAAWRLLLAEGPAAFGDLIYVGQLPFGDSLAMHEVLAASFRGAEVEFYFDPASGDLTGLVFSAADDIDPCQIIFDDFRDTGGKLLPHTWHATFGDEAYVDIHVEKYQSERIAEEEP